MESSWTRDRTWVPCLGWQILNHWTTRKVLLRVSKGRRLHRAQAQLWLHSCPHWPHVLNKPSGVSLPVVFLLELSVQFSSVAQSCPTLCDPMNCSTPGLPVHHQLPEFTQTHVHWVGDSIQPSHLLSSPSPAAIPPSIRVFSNESTLCMRWPKYWSFSFSIIPSKEHPELISFRMDWLDLLAVQGTLKSLLLFKISAFFKVAQPKAFLG